MSRHDSAKYAFFYVLSLVALIFMAISVGMVFFQIINKEIVDVINDYSGRYSDEAIKFAISAIIISTPIYYFTAKQIYKNLRHGNLEVDAAVRKWFTYLILLVSMIVMIVWLIMTINGFLDGELTTKAILKAVVALFISGAIFSFYLYDIKRANAQRRDKVIQISFMVSLLIVLIALVISFLVVESPTETRQRKMDQRITSSLYQVDNAVNEYYRNNGVLPENLKQLQEDVNYILEEDINNPISNEMYEYKIVGDTEYQICTNFQSSSKEMAEQEYSTYYVDKTWLHDAGYQCFSQKINNPDFIKEPRLLD